MSHVDASGAARVGVVLALIGVALVYLGRFGTSELAMLWGSFGAVALLFSTVAFVSAGILYYEKGDRIRTRTKRSELPFALGAALNLLVSPLYTTCFQEQFPRHVTLMFVLVVGGMSLVWRWWPWPAALLQTVVFAAIAICYGSM